MDLARPARFARFGPFQLDLHSRELRRNGINIRVPDQSARVLAMLIEKPGEVVTREALQQRIWPNGTIVEFDRGINAVVRRLRRVLDDSAGEPKFIETLPRRGYRFLVPIELVDSAETAPPPERGLASSELAEQTISHYRIGKKLGQGAMGVVYQAEDIRLGRSVALKFLPEELEDDRQALERFDREARAVSALNHPNICTLYDIGEVGGRPFLAMEFLEGRTLAERIQAKPVEIAELIDLGIQIADALEAAHAKGIIHRDIKPANIFVTNRGQVKIMDFGLAKLSADWLAGSAAAQQAGASTTAQSADVTGSSSVAMGTVAYMSPEQARREALDVRTDLFSFGVVLCEMATAKRPFTEVTEAAKSPTKLNHASPAQLRPNLPAQLSSIIDRALEKDRTSRYQYAAEMRADLKQLRAAMESARVKHFWIRPLHAGVLVATLVTAGITIWPRVVGRGTPLINAEAVPVPLTTYGTGEDSPTFSPDGNRVAFYWDGPKPNSQGIYVKVIGQDSPTLLARTKQGYPAWSPDGRLIAFLDQVSGEACGVFLVPAAGGLVRKIAEISAQEVVASGYYSNTCVPVSWHPNGKWLVGVDKIAPSESCGLFLISVNGEEKRRLTSPSGIRGDHWPAVSPDGHAVAFIRHKIGDGGWVDILELSDDLKPVGEPNAMASMDYLTTLAWMPDGRSLLFSSGNSDRPSLFRLQVLPGWRPGRRERLSFAGDGAFAPTMSRQGRLAFLRLPGGDADIWRLELSGGRWSGRAPVRLISSTRAEDTVAYSPDGKRIAFASTRSGRWEIWICDSDGSDPVQLTSIGGLEGGPYVTSPSWSPDGRWIYFTSLADGRSAIYVISSEGGRPKRLTDGQALWNSVSRDGRWIYFGPAGPSTGQAWKIPTAHGDPVQVTRHGGGTGRESPDGRVLYYTKVVDKDTAPDSSALWKVPIEGGEETQVLGTVHCGNFAVTDRGIYFIQSFFAPTVISFLDFSTNQIGQIAKFDGQPACGFSLSPDGRYLLYTLFEPFVRSGMGLMLVEDFH